MKGSLDHAALCVKELDWYVDYFEQVLEMTIEKTAGEKPTRKIWFNEGIQLVESTESTVLGNSLDHIALKTDDRLEAVKACCIRGCKRVENKENWIVLPNGIKIEFM